MKKIIMFFSFILTIISLSNEISTVSNAIASSNTLRYYANGENVFSIGVGKYSNVSAVSFSYTTNIYNYGIGINLSTNDKEEIGLSIGSAVTIGPYNYNYNDIEMEEKILEQKARIEKNAKELRKLKELLKSIGEMDD